jgi:NAD(P)-dependent dehydrogenase (short-subunit alcohol dehydrogenase family)
VGDLLDKRVLVVGASSGIGRVVARMAVAQGAQVAFAARRLPLLEEAVAEAGGGVAIRCDVRDTQSCTDVVDETVARLGGIDALVYATAVDPLVRISDADAQRWADTLATNVVGASLVCRAAMPHLSASSGRVVFVSASSIGRPVPLMGVYACSKAALEELVRAWRSEHRDVSFCSARVGSTLGTGVADSWDPELSREMGGHYANGGYDLDNGPGVMTVEDCAASIIVALTVPVCIREFTATAAAGA